MIILPDYFWALLKPRPRGSDNFPRAKINKRNAAYLITKHIRLDPKSQCSYGWDSLHYEGYRAKYDGVTACRVNLTPIPMPKTTKTQEKAPKSNPSEIFNFILFQLIKNALGTRRIMTRDMIITWWRWELFSCRFVQQLPVSRELLTACRVILFRIGTLSIPRYAKCFGPGSNSWIW